MVFMQLSIVKILVPGRGYPFLLHHQNMVELLCLLQQKLGNIGNVGMGQAMKLKWIALDKSSGQPVVKRKVNPTVTSP